MQIGITTFDKAEYFPIGILLERKTKQLNIGFGFLEIYFIFGDSECK